MEQTAIEAPVKPAPREVSVVAIPTVVFKQVIEQLASQPYKDVGVLMSVLGAYKAQIVTTTEE